MVSLGLKSYEFGTPPEEQFLNIVPNAVAYLESFLDVAPYRKTTDMKINTKIR